MKTRQKLELYFRDMLGYISDGCLDLCVKETPPPLSDFEKICLNKCF